MDKAPEAQDDQAARWNGPAGNAWVDSQEVLDRLFRPLEQQLVDAVTAAAKSRVLDVGCGTGGTTVAVARALGAAGRCVGIDISEPMIAAARDRAAREQVPAAFVRANAQDHAFEPASFDLIISRFGVMFFDDPVRAFANLRRSGTADAELRLIVWRSAEDNPFMTTAERTAAPILPDLPPRKPDAPGQFGFANAPRVRSILEQSGWIEIDIQPIDVECVLPERELVGYVMRLGPVGLALQDADDRTRERVVEIVRPAFEPFVRGKDVRFTAACWMVSARRRDV